jgi:hypothetical protein
MSILEEHARYLKKELHLNCQQIENSEEMLESFVPLEDIIKYNSFDGCM